MMKPCKILLAAIVSLLPLGSVWAQSDVRYQARDVEIVHEDDLLTVSMAVDLSVLEPDRNAQILLVPVLYGEGGSARLRPVGIYSRGRFYSLARSGRTATPLNAGDFQFYEKDKPDLLSYTDSLPYEDWMDGAFLRIDTEISGCCGAALGHAESEALAVYDEPEPEIIEFIPHFVYVRPEAEAVVKERSISGEAYVIFESGKSEVAPKYRNNETELAKIRSTIDSVRFDADIVITQISLCGYSSPEGKYAKNEELARKRTEAIRDYVSGLYNLPGDIYATASVAENWEGLRAAVEAADQLKNRDKILEIIDSDLDPDRKEAQIKAFSRDYSYLSKEIFPTLRRTDYQIRFTVRSYTTPEEILAMMRTRPYNLSLNEFFLLSQQYVTGTPEFNEVFATAAFVYPEDATANINAANAAMSVGDLESAARYLEKAGDSGLARYSRGLLEALRGHFEQAARYFTSAELSGVPQAGAQLSLVTAILDQQEQLAK